MPNFTGTGGNDIWTGGTANETAAGGGGADTLNGGGGSDFLYTFNISPSYTRPYYGNPWTAPLLDSGADVDTVNGGAGNDLIFAGYGDNINGGADTDGLLISFQGATSGVTVDFSQLVSGSSISVGGGTIQSIEYIEWVEGSEFGDTIIMGDDSANFAPVFGNGGDDHIIGGYYTGDIHGGDGDDIIDRGDSPYGFQHFGEAGNDLLIGSYNGELLDGGEGDDELRGNGGYDDLFGGAGNDLIDGGYESDDLSGGDGNDTMYGSAGDDVVDGQNGDDTIYGDYSPLVGGFGLGDTIFGGAGADVIYGEGGDDRIWSGERSGDWSNPGLDDTGTEKDVVNGGDGDDQISVGYGDDADGGDGTDTLRLSLAGATAGVVVDLADLAGGGTAQIDGATLAGFEEISYVGGSAYADRIILGSHNLAPLIDGGAGNDTITIGATSASVDGGEGNDRIFSGAAADDIVGGAGRDIVDYRFYASGVTVNLQAGTGTGGDTISEVESILGSEFADTLTGDGAANTLTGNGGNDIIYGGAGNDSLTGGAGYDQLHGGLGDDLYYAYSDDSEGSVIEADGEGYDTVKSSITFALPNYVERLVLGGTAAINGYGNESANNLTGNSGANTLMGNGGNDFILGGGGLDQLNGGEGSDTYYVASFANYADASFADTGSSGWDIIRFAGTTAGTLVMQAGDTGIEEINVATSSGLLPNFSGTTAINVDASALGSGVTIRGNSGANVLTGTAFNDELYGNNGIDHLIGGNGNDILDGGRGDDIMEGGQGFDHYYVDSAGDMVVEVAGAGNDTVSSTVNYTLGANVEYLLLLGSAALNGTGNGADNSLTGNAGANILSGLDGWDILDGGDGDDTLYGGDGDDELRGGAGNDTLIGGTSYGYDYMYGGAGNDTLDGSEGDDELRGDEGNDTLIGGTGYGIDRMYGGAGDDTLYGGSGNDKLLGDAGNDWLQGDDGADAMTGGDGDDAYVVDEAGDLVMETNSTGGRDIVHSRISYTLGAWVEDLTLTGTNSISGTGNGLNNVITGNTAGNRLDGAGGADTMHGGDGNDTYVVDSSSDLAIEDSAGGGNDTVEASVSFTLGSNVEILKLTGALSIGGIGNGLDNIIYGNAAGNLIDGAGGADSMRGGDGNDVYVVDNAGDSAIETSGTGGTDRVDSSVSFTLGSNVENLTLTGDAAINGTGNSLANVLTGNSAANSLIGNAGNDILYGENGNDSLNGGTGQDRFYGGTGADEFIFGNGDFAGMTSSTADRIHDFSHAEGDHIRLDGVDANSGLAGDQAFAFIGSGAFTGVAGQLRYQQVSGNTYVQGDIDGDGQADFWIRLDGLHALVNGDFIL